MQARKNALLTFLFGGLLPVVAFTVIEEVYGLFWGLIAGAAFSLGEIAFEKVTQGKVSAITWATAGMILVLGGVSLAAADGIWFKLQPALLAGFFAALMLGSVAIGKPFLRLAWEKGGTQIPPPLMQKLPGITLRLGIFFAAHGVVGAWAAFSWSTRAWALLKGVGFTMSFLAYLGAEMLMLRRSLIRARHGR